MKYLLFLLCSSLLLSSACHKGETPDPNSTYYECKVDGRLYGPDNCANCLTCTIYRDSIFMLGANHGFEVVAIEIRDQPKIRVVNYDLNGVKAGGGYKNSTSPTDRYDTDAQHTGTLVISNIDEAARIVSGTFSYSAYNPVQGKTVNVTDGKFRLKYTTN